MEEEQIKRIAEYLAPDTEKERVVDMGGTVMKPQAQIILEQGKETQAKETAVSLYEDGMSIEKIVKYVRYPVEVIEEWLGLATV